MDLRFPTLTAMLRKLRLDKILRVERYYLVYEKRGTGIDYYRRKKKLYKCKRLIGGKFLDPVCSLFSCLIFDHKQVVIFSTDLCISFLQSSVTPFYLQLLDPVQMFVLLSFSQVSVHYSQVASNSVFEANN